MGGGDHHFFSFPVGKFDQIFFGKPVSAAFFPNINRIDYRDKDFLTAEIIQFLLNNPRYVF
jgi:hypothetical protein